MDENEFFYSETILGRKYYFLLMQFMFPFLLSLRVFSYGFVVSISNTLMLNQFEIEMKDT